MSSKNDDIQSFIENTRNTADLVTLMMLGGKSSMDLSRAMGAVARSAAASAPTAAAQKTAAETQAKQNCDENQDSVPILHVLKQLVGTCMVDSDLENCSQVMPLFLNACGADIANRKIVREKLLPHVFNANPKELYAAIETLGARFHPKLLLTKASFREGYDSKKLREFFCFREWGGVSPLQAAYLCGDGPFIGLKLLAYILRDNNLLPTDHEKLRVEAAQQLQELSNRVMKKEVEEAVTAASFEAKECADSAEFLAPFKALIRAYKYYISRYDSLASEKNWDEIDRLWGIVGECHRRLPRYGLQEFCSDIPFDPTPAFNTEPNRAECRGWNNELLDLDELGINSFVGLYKGVVWGAAGACGGGALCDAAVWRTAVLDLAAITRLCELREIDLRNTLNALQSRETALTHINREQAARAAAR